MDRYAPISTIEDEEDLQPYHRPHPRFRRLAFYLARDAALPELSQDAERNLIARAQDRSRPVAATRATSSLIEHHAAFLQTIAEHVAIKNDLEHAVEDLESEAVASFIRTIRRYRGEVHDNTRLSTFATYRVSGDVMTYALRNRASYAIGTSSHDRMVIFGFEDFTKTFQQENSIAFDDSNPEHVRLLAEISQTSEKAVRRVSAQRRNLHALDIDTIDIEDDSAGPEECALRTSTARAVAQAVHDVRSRLCARNRHILDVSLEEGIHDDSIRMRLARNHKITPERVGQIYRTALEDIRSRLKRRGITSAHS